MQVIITGTKCLYSILAFVSYSNTMGIKIAQSLSQPFISFHFKSLHDAVSDQILAYH